MATLVQNAAAAASYVVNQCTWFVATHADWVPGGLGNAEQWIARAKTGNFLYQSGASKGQPLVVSKAPVVGDVVAFANGQQGALFNGHVAIVTAVHTDWTYDVVEGNFPEGVLNHTRKNLDPRKVLGFIASSDNARVVPMAFGQQYSKQQLADMAFAGGAPAGQGVADVPATTTDAPSNPIADALNAVGTTVARAAWIALGAILVIFGIALVAIPDVARAVKGQVA